MVHPHRPAHKSFLLALARFFDRLAGYRVYRAVALAGVELAIALIAAVSAITIIQSGEFWKWQAPLLFAGLVLVSSKILVGLATQSFSGRWRYVGVRDAAIVTRAAVIAAVLAFAMLEFLNLAGVRLRLVGADVVIYLVLACGMRLTIRSLHEWERRVRIGNGTARRRALIVGAGESGSALIKSMRSSPKLLMDPVAVADDDPNKRGSRLHGAPVAGPVAELRRIVEKYQADEIVIAIPSATADQIGRVVDAC
ncbi:MAG TPA: hypothetical protein VKC15_00150, partial [Gemmatimonadales bacterium]|nr:hypothetical protein [Gemmatimonadales bacterium]